MIVNLNKSKTECVLFGTHQKTSQSSQLEIRINGTQITESNTYEYLDVTMDKNLNYSEHLNKTLKKASSRVDCYLGYDTTLVQLLPKQFIR